MPLEIICEKCRTSLYCGIDIKFSGDVLKHFNRKCKKCGEPLSTQDFTIEVETIENKV